MTSNLAIQSLLIVSNKIRSVLNIQSAIQLDTLLLQFRFDSGYDKIIEVVRDHLNGRKVCNVAFLLYSTPFAVYLCSNDGKMQQFNLESILSSQEQQKFFQTLVAECFEENDPMRRIDFLSCNHANTVDSKDIIQEFTKQFKVTCNMSKDIWGNDIPIENIMGTNRFISAAELYFRIEKVNAFGTSVQQSLKGFEKIRTVGKGAYGLAVLYRKKDDDSEVILKEINMHDLTANERNLAMNEVKVLSMLDHPNIISYFDSFEEDGILMIEMEYADGGTLAHYLSQQVHYLEEIQILKMFRQIVAAIHYIHEHKILHRDLKSANIFLTKEGVVKIGDFGIAKLLAGSKDGANTVLGTPYYISPEMCEGKPYDDKSDIWALGCILYELACFQKTFEGSNLPALVNKIMKGQFAPVKGNYTEEFKDLITSMLQLEPSNRPSAEEILYKKLPELIKRYEQPTTEESNSDPVEKKKTRSVVYYMDLASLSLSPVDLPSKLRVNLISAGLNHMVALSSEHMVYTWGQNEHGQLAHGDNKSRNVPRLVEALRGKSIIRISCGDGFSVFGSDNGIIMTCGDGSKGCLGHGDWASINKPKLIESLLSIDVTSIASGNQHVVAVSSDGLMVFAWGQGGSGRTGLGSEDSKCEPSRVTIDQRNVIRSVFAGTDASMFLTDAGLVLATGSNAYNKLGLNKRQGFLMTMTQMFNKTDVEGVRSPLVVKALSRYRAVNVSMGHFHTAVTLDPNHLVTFGCNQSGQLGVGNTRLVNIVTQVRNLRDKVVTRTYCGKDFTVATTNQNELLFWGCRPVPPTQTSESSETECGADDEIEDKGATSGGGVEKSSRTKGIVKESAEIFTVPMAILRLNNPGMNNPNSLEYVTLSDVNFCQKRLLVQVETTAPPPRRKSLRSESDLQSTDELSSAVIVDSSEYFDKSTQRIRNSTNNSMEADITSGSTSLPTWIKTEFEEAENFGPFLKKPNQTVSKSANPSQTKLDCPNLYPDRITNSPNVQVSSKSPEITSSSELDTTGVSAKKQAKIKEILTPIPSDYLPRSYTKSKSQSPKTAVKRHKSRPRSQKETEDEDQKPTERDLFLIEKEKSKQKMRNMKLKQKEASNKNTKENEQKLLTDIGVLRQQLEIQNKQMEDNHNIIVDLKNQLSNLQEEHQRMSQMVQETHSNRSSKICSIQ